MRSGSAVDGFVVEFADAFVCECEALAQRGVGAALDSGGCRLGRLRYGGQSAELVAEFGLGVAPGAGDALLTELKWTSAHVNGEVAVSGVTVTARDGRW